jgi:hypothetical protein
LEALDAKIPDSFKVDCLRFLIGSDQPEGRVLATAFELRADEGFAAPIGFEA